MGGVLLIGAGAWLLCQLLGGNALQRLNITTDSSSKPGVGESLGKDAGGAASQIADALAGRVGSAQKAK